MTTRPGPRTLVALAIAAFGAFAGFLLNGDVQAALVVLVAGVAAVLVVGGGDPHPEPLASANDREGEPPLAEVVEAFVEPVLVIAANRVALANRAARALLGDHILGEDVRLAIRHPAAAERLLNPDDQTSEAPIHLVGLGTREQRWEMRIHAIGPGMRIVHLTDRTGSYAAERMRVDFVANASHELRTPLASLLGFIETLRDEAGDDPGTRARFLKVMFDEARRMQRLIDDLISLSRIEAEKYRAPDQQVDLAELVEEVRTELAASADERGHDLVTEVADVSPIRGDRAQLSQLLHNLVGNAMKYGRPDTPIRIAVSPNDSMVQISVTDEGEGIAPEHLPRLTERFYRVDSGRSRAAGGTGLGLAIVKHIVERHRGRLDIASTVGKGTTVTILLPAHPLS